MKGSKILLYFLIGILSFSCSKDDNKSLPNEAMALINEYYSDLVIERTGLFEGKYYVMFNDGTEIEFTREGEWRYVKTTNKTNIPVSSLEIVPVSIKTFFEGQYKTDLKIIDSMGFDTELGYTFRLTKQKDSLMLSFDKYGVLINSGGVETPVSIIQGFIRETFPGVAITKITSEAGNYIVDLDINATIIFTGTGKDWVSVSSSEILNEVLLDYYLLDPTKEWFEENYGTIAVIKKIEKNKEGAFTVYTEDSRIIKFTSTGELTPEERIREFFEEHLPDYTIKEIKNRIASIKNDPTTISFNTTGKDWISIDNIEFITPAILKILVPNTVLEVLKEQYTPDLSVFTKVSREGDEYTVLVNDGSKIKLKEDGTILEQTLTTDQAIQKFLEDNFTNPVADYSKKPIGNSWEVKFEDGKSKITILFNNNATDWTSVSSNRFLDKKLVGNILPSPIAAVIGGNEEVYQIDRTGSNYTVTYNRGSSSKTATFKPDGTEVK